MISWLTKIFIGFPLSYCCGKNIRPGHGIKHQTISITRITTTFYYKKFKKKNKNKKEEEKEEEERGNAKITNYFTTFLKIIDVDNS